jgi:ABC-type multidrug transport system fused ATPase/permease subunit
VKDHSIVERGTHAELLASGGFYSELHDIQFRKEEPAVVLA